MRPWFGCPALLLTLAACGGDGPTEPPPSGDGVALVIAPGALLFPEAGATQSLRTYMVSAEGDSTLVAATFESSNPAIVSVGPGGVAIGGAAVGSAQIVARSGGLTSAPVLALRATPAAGALLVADSQVVGEVEAVDPSAPYDVGRQYRVRLRGASPAVGQIVLATGAAPIGGRVISAAGSANETEVMLAMVPLRELFEVLSIDERLPLTGGIVSGPSQDLHGIRLSRSPTGGTRFSSSPGARFQASAIRTASVGGRIEQAFELGPFKCKLEAPAPIVVPISMSTFSGDLNESLVLDIVVENGVVLRKLVVDGTIRPTLTIAPRITAALEGKGECKWKVREFPLPITGVLAAVLGGQVPVGIGFEIGAKSTLGQLGADVTFQSTVTAKLGFDCTGACQWVQAFDATAPDITVKPVIPDLGTSTRIELGASAFGWAELTLGLTLWDDETTRLKLLSAKAGLEQKFELASADAQAADPAYASSYSLKPAVEVKAAAEYTPLENLLQVNLTLFTYAPELPAISQSPRGTFAITPAAVAAGSDSELGEPATFTVTLTDATYFGAYAVEAVQIRWRRPLGETVVLESGRPGCSDLEAAQDQLSFTCQTDFLAEHAGTQTFHAFVMTRIWGVPVPVPLEVGPNGAATLVIAEADHATTVTLEGLPSAGSVANVSFRNADPSPTCRDSDPGSDDVDRLPRLVLSAMCSENAVSDEGAAMSGRASTSVTYAFDLEDDELRAFTVTAQASASAQGEGEVPGQFASEAGQASSQNSSNVSFEFEVTAPEAQITLAGHLTSAIATPDASTSAGASVRIRRSGSDQYFAIAGREGFSGAIQPNVAIGSTLRLPRGVYSLDVQAQAAAATYTLEPNSEGTAGLTVTLTVAP